VKYFFVLSHFILLLSQALTLLRAGPSRCRGPS
jgi:hypothetical protein